jgi:hypothetical protein
MLKQEILIQFDHGWRVFTRLVTEFDEKAWFEYGRGANTPARFCLHILQSFNFYMMSDEYVVLASRKNLSCDPWEVEKKELPTQSEMLEMILYFKNKTTNWVNDMVLDDVNKDFDWTGETKFSVLIFVLRHFMYHLGEVSGLLNEVKNGDVDDIYVNS